ncbi:universal stress protein A-like protein isoform X1 [Tripterygium wilfordii]|uniref:universal stress protein A-like protein isoform X1 n=1 Tax=Tripterygium wilfordii TaxID=458696 RepID=UPI0018F83158|nr:universal stress protein A-like protein isoform X1 [Tripterygium wilfordii]
MADVAGKERRIVVTVDESEESRHALSWCLENVISSNSKDTLLLLYVQPPRAVYTAMDGSGGRHNPRGIFVIFNLLIHIWQLVSREFWFAGFSGYLFSADIMATMEKYSNDVAQSVIEKAKRMCQDVKVETRVEHGDARDVICQMVEKLNADMLVMGSHGYGLIKRAFLGSVSNHCAQNVKCPVLIVKKPKSPSDASN